MDQALEAVMRLHEHRAWTNRNLVEAARLLSDDQLNRSFEIGQGSLWRSLTHLFAAEYVWLAALNGDPQPVAPGDVADSLPGNQLAADALASLDELLSEWTALEARWRLYLQQLTPESLHEPVYKKSTSSGFGRTFGTKRLDVLLHVCTHAQYTTAQAINILRHLGVQNLPESMLISLARKEANDRVQ